MPSQPPALPDPPGPPGVPAARGPGRPRSETARRAAMDGAMALLRERGYRAVTMEGIAARAGVGKQTLYRWWPSPAAIVLEALVEAGGEIVDAPPSADWRADLEGFLRRSFTALRGELGPVQRALMAEAQLDPAFAAAYREGFIAHRRAALLAVLRRGAAAGGLGAGADLELLADLAYGAMWYRLLLEHGSLSDAAAGDIAAAVVAASGGAVPRG